MSRRARRNKQPKIVRASSAPASPPPFPGAVGGRSLGNTAANMGLYAGNVQGDNSLPTSSYYQPNPGGAVQFAPGDPLRPIPGLGDRWGLPRAFPYGVGSNIQPAPRHTEAVPFEQLRNLAALYEGIQMCQSVLFRVLRRLDLAFVPRPEVLGEGNDASSPKWVDGGRRVAEWFEFPDRIRDLPAWMTAAYRDILELDALGVYHHQNRGGGLYALELLAGDFIAPLVDSGGRRPLPPAPAYLQMLYGVPAQLLRADEMDYLLETSRTESMYGLSRVERIIMKVNLALRKGHFDLARFTDGATPAGVMETQNPDLFRMTPDQVQLWQDMFNAAMAGNDAMRVRVKAMPPGWTFRSLQTEQIATELDRWLLNITAADHGLSMDELGMTETSNRSVGDSQENVVFRNAVKPTSDFFAKYFSRLVARYDGMPIAANNATVSRAASATKPKQGTWDARYMAMWQGIEEPEDFNKKLDAGAKLFQTGLYTKLETLRWLKLPVAPGATDVPAFASIQGGMDGIVVLDDIEENRALQQQARQAKVDTAQAGLKIQQDQGKQLDQSINGGGNDEFGGEDFGEENDEGDEGNDNQTSGSEPESPQPTAPSGSTSATNTTKKQSNTPKNSSGDNSVDAGEDDGAEAAVNDLITQAKKKTAKRMTLPEEDTDGDTDSSEPRSRAYRAGGTDDGSGRDVYRRSGYALGDVDADGDATEDDSDGDDGGDHNSESRSAPNAVRSGTHVYGTSQSRSEGVSRVCTNASNRDELRAALADIGFGIADDTRGASPDRGAGSASRRDSDGNTSGTRSGDSDDRDTIRDEWRRYRDVALRATKRGRSMPDFESAILPQGQHAWVASQLATVTSADEVRGVFAAVREVEEAELTRTAVFGAHHRIIGNIGEDGVFHPSEGVPHAQVVKALATHFPGSPIHTALSHYLEQQAGGTANVTSQHEQNIQRAQAQLAKANADYTAARQALSAAGKRVIDASATKRIQGYKQTIDAPAKGVSPEEYQRLKAERDALRAAYDRAYLPVRDAEHALTAARFHAEQAKLLQERPNGATATYHPDVASLAKASSTAEVQQWLQTTFPDTQFYLDGMHPTLAKSVAAEFAELGHQYPEIMASLKGVAMVTDAKAQQDALTSEAIRLTHAANALAKVSSHPGGTIMTFNADFTDAARFASLERQSSGIHHDVPWMVGTGAGATVRHEFGHVVEEFLDRSSSGGEYGRHAVQYQKNTYPLYERSTISVYSNHDSLEQWAEAFAAAKYGTPEQQQNALVREIQSILAPYRVGGGS